MARGRARHRNDPRRLELRPQDSGGSSSEEGPAVSRFVLKTLPGIDRPALATVVPNMRGAHTYMLDFGANVDCSAEHLLQFGIMGAMLVAAVEHKDRPSVGLLNIGAEDIKGNDAVKQAAELLRNSGLNFFGNVEGDDIYKGTTDVVVCDGFVGNVALKASEGVARMMAAALRQEFTRSPLRRLAALAALPVLSAFRRRMDPGRYNGASLLGLRGIVIKSHGSADAFAFRHFHRGRFEGEALGHDFDGTRRRSRGGVLMGIRHRCHSQQERRPRHGN